MKSTLSNGKRSDRDAETFVCKSPFYQTRDMFKEFIGVDTPLAYSTWSLIRTRKQRRFL